MVVRTVQVGDDQVDLAGEVPVERRERDLALLDDPLDPHAVDALGVEQQRRGGQYALARFGALLGGRRFGEPHKIAAAALYRDIGMALAGRSASVGVRDRVRTRNASCTPRLVHVSADGVLAAQLLTCNRAICPFLPFRALRCAARKWPVYRDFAMARPGLEPGTPRFSVVRSGMAGRTLSLETTRFSAGQSAR
jgi:hypothetical protein